MNDFYIALGANLPSSKGSPSKTLKSAVQILEKPGVSVVATSRFYQTPCFPPGAGPDYINAAVHLRSDLTPEALLENLHAIEADFGRERIERWGMRTLDLDLLACGSRILPDLETYNAWRALSPEAQKASAPDRLILPHPRLQDRAFVLVPLRDIAAEWRHPVLHKTVDDMYNALSPDDLAEIIPL
ncbi:2-amino-4-hydroxy-6-hydroxymethyldihydropteridine diphosphokinase [Marivita sp. S0852]|uniref:2-amino-4-hydroxy-6- hydroxymethyldihydropteridine diphosphokinase n=1 Tax=Marivita sp. S0852 TaxID=3373893 RepID=UPI003981A1C0